MAALEKLPVLLAGSHLGFLQLTDTTKILPGLSDMGLIRQGLLLKQLQSNRLPIAMLVHHCCSVLVFVVPSKQYRLNLIVPGWVGGQVLPCSILIFGLVGLAVVQLNSHLQ